MTELLVVNIADPLASRYVPLPKIGSYMLGHWMGNYIPILVTPDGSYKLLTWGDDFSCTSIQQHIEEQMK